MTAAPIIRECPAPGLYQNVPAEVYFGWDAVNASSLKILAAESAEHYRYAADHAVEATIAMIFGTAVHAAILDPEGWEKRYIIAGTCCGVKANGGACGFAGKILSGGRWYCGVHGKNVEPDTVPAVLDDEGNLIKMPVLTEEGMDSVRAMSIRAMRDYAVRRMVENSLHEVCIVWEDAVTGILMKARLDMLDRQGLIIPDIKTCEDASEDGFARQIANFSYDIQAAVYTDAATSLDGELHDNFVFIAIEKKAPFTSACWKAHKGMIDLGRHRYRNALKLYAECKANNHWPGYHDHQVVPINVPHYFFQKESQK